MHGRDGLLVIDDYAAAARVFLALVRGEYHTQLMLAVVDSIPEDVRRAHVVQAVRHFLKLYNS